MENKSNALSVAPKTFTELQTFASMVSKTQLIPTAYRGKPEDIFVGMQWGLELGLKPLQALQNIAVINGKPSIYGDAMIGLARTHDACESIVEEFDDESMTAICKAKRKGQPEQVTKFSIEDAKTAKLWGKQGPWTQYPKRMLQMRARAFAIRDVFPDALQGLISQEEARDYPEEKQVEAQVVEPPKKPAIAYATKEQTNGFIAKCAEEEIEIPEEILNQIEEGGIPAVELKEVYYSLKSEKADRGTI